MQTNVLSAQGVSASVMIETYKITITMIKQSEGRSEARTQENHKQDYKPYKECFSCHKSNKEIHSELDVCSIKSIPVSLVQLKV